MSPRSPLHGGISAIFSVRRRSGLAALSLLPDLPDQSPDVQRYRGQLGPAQAGEGQEVIDELAHHPGVVPDDVEFVDGVVVEFIGVLPEDHPAVPVDGPERGAKVVGDGVAEALQLRRALGHSLLQRLVCLSKRRLGAFDLGDVDPHLQDEGGAVAVGEGEVVDVVVAAVRAGPLPVVGLPGLQDGVGLADFAGLGPLEEVLVTALAPGLAEPLPEEPVGKGT